MTRSFTNEEVNRIIQDGEKLGVAYTKEEQEIVQCKFAFPLGV